jgi:hypothetical protein
MADSQTHPVPPASGSDTFAGRSADGEAQSADAGETANADCVELSSEPECSALAKRIRDPQRDYPIVCLTARPGERDPALPATAVREIVGPGVPIYFVRTRRLTRYLGSLLPPRFDAWDGATRVWWPGVSETSDPLEHPRIYDPSGRYGPDNLQRLAAEFATKPRPELTLKQQLVLAARQRSQLTERTERLERVLASTRQELDEALRGISPASNQAVQGDSTERPDAASDALGSEDPGEEIGEQSPPNQSDVEGMLYKLIWSQWVDICPPDERAEHPPRRFVISSELIRTIVQRRVDVPIERLAWVCAMVIGDRAIGHAGIDAHIYRGNEESERKDGAKAMRAALKRSAGGPRLHYWSLPNGTIEFAQIGYHDLALS